MLWSMRESGEGRARNFLSSARGVIGARLSRCYGAGTSGRSPWGRHRASPIHRRRAQAASFITGSRPALVCLTCTGRARVQN